MEEALIKYIDNLYAILACIHSLNARADVVVATQYQLYGHFKGSPEMGGLLDACKVGYSC